MIENAKAPSSTTTDVPDGLLPFLVAVFGLTALLLLPAGLAQRAVIGGPVERFIPLMATNIRAPREPRMR